jgi:hypothetical protein
VRQGSLRLPDNKLLSVSLLVAGLVALFLLLPGVFHATAPPLQVALGWGAFVVCAALIAGGVGIYLAPELHRFFAQRHGWRVSWKSIVLAELLLLLLLILTHLPTDRSLEAALAGQGGGLVGWAGSALLTGLAGKAGALGIVLAATAVTVWFLGRELMKISALGSPVSPPAGWLGKGLRTRIGNIPRISLHGGARHVGDGLAYAIAWWSRALRGLLPSRADTVIHDEQPVSSPGRTAGQAGEPRGAGSSPKAGALHPPATPSDQPKPIRQSAAKDRLPRSCAPTKASSLAAQMSDCALKRSNRPWLSSAYPWRSSASRRGLPSRSSAWNLVK